MDREERLCVLHALTFEVLDRVGDRVDFSCVLVGDFDGVAIGTKFLLEGHNQFHQVEGIRSQVVLEGRFFGHIAGIDAEFVNHDVGDALKHGSQRFISMRGRRLDATKIALVIVIGHPPQGFRGRISGELLRTDPSTPFTKRALLSLPNFDANSVASLIITLLGTCARLIIS